MSFENIKNLEQDLGGFFWLKFWLVRYDFVFWLVRYDFVEFDIFLRGFSKFCLPYVLCSIDHRALILVPIERAKKFQQPGQRNAALILFPSPISLWEKSKKFIMKKMAKIEFSSKSFSKWFFNPLMLWKNDQCAIADQMSSLLTTFGDFEIFRNFGNWHFPVDFPNFLYLKSCVLLTVER